MKDNRLFTFCGILLIIWVVISATAMLRANDRPDPFVRLTNSYGGTSCSGGVIRADETGVWVSTAAHCTGRSGARAWATFYWRGYQSPVIEGRVYGQHPRWDCAVLWFPADSFPVPPAVTPPADPRDVRVGQLVYSVGSNAGGTRVPAVQKMRITRFTPRSGRYEFYLNDAAWGGHSGGAIIDAETNRLVGNLWGSNSRQSIITSVSALWEVLLQRHDRQPQAMFSVDDPIAASPQDVTFHLYGDQESLVVVYRDLATHDCLRNLRWQHHDDDYGHLKITWSAGGQRWYVNRWDGAHAFLARVRQTGVDVSNCSGGRGWPPVEIGGGRRPSNPWEGLGPAEDPRVNELQKTIEELQKQLSNSKKPEPVEKKQRVEGVESLPEMTRRAVEQMQKQREAIAESNEYLRQLVGNEDRDAPFMVVGDNFGPILIFVVIALIAYFVARK